MQKISSKPWSLTIAKKGPEFDRFWLIICFGAANWSWALFKLRSDMICSDSSYIIQNYSFQDVSDMEILSGHHSTLCPILEAKREEIVGDWRRKIYLESEILKSVFEEMKKKKQKDGVCDLLRNIRNLVSLFQHGNIPWVRLSLPYARYIIYRPISVSSSSLPSRWFELRLHHGVSTKISSPPCCPEMLSV